MSPAGTCFMYVPLHSKHNDNTWTVPGGNVDDADSSLLGTATREAMEELGSVPPFEVKAQILTK
jgi:8-oxo-dGTP pyrophosphatase MutT (NUDIX family)